MKKWSIAVGAFLFVVHPAMAAVFESGPQRVNLVEAFSSEGCSNCPAADEWVNALRTHEGLWKNFVPVVFHVDYWDELGWKDIYSSPEFTKRERAYSDEWKSSALYTPCLVVNGREWKPGVLAPFEAPGGAAGSLKAATQEADGSVEISYQPPEASGYNGPWKAHLAPLLFDLRSNVKRGENAGRVLPHEFVAAAHREARMEKEGGVFKARIVISAPKAKGVAVWVTQGDALEPVQSTGGYL